jgi:hypothetical protein
MPRDFAAENFAPIIRTKAAAIGTTAIKAYIQTPLFKFFRLCAEFNTPAYDNTFFSSVQDCGCVITDEKIN